MKTKLENLIVDSELIELRPINLFLVNRYQQAYRSGAIFPSIIIDQKRKKIVSGNHRYYALVKEFGLKHEVEIIAKTYKDRKSILIDFTKENSAHGMPLSGFSRRQITIKLLNKGCSASEIANLFGVSVKRIEKWTGYTVLVVGENTADTEPKLVKRGPQMDGKVITAKQYKNHVKADLGIQPTELVNQLVRWLKNDWIEKNNEIVIQFNELRILIDDFLAAKKTVAK